MPKLLPVLITLLLSITFAYSWRVDYSCYACPTDKYYVSGTDKVQFIFSQVGPGIHGFNIWLATGPDNSSSIRTAVLGEDVSTATYRVDVPPNLTTGNNYYFDILANNSDTGLVLGPFRIQAPTPSSSSTLASATSSETSSSTESSSGSSQAPTIVGASVGSVGGIAVIIGAIFFFRRRNKKTQENPASQSLMTNTYPGGAPPQVSSAPQNAQYAPPVVYTPQHHTPEPPAQYHTNKPDEATSPPKPQDEAPAPPYRYQSPHVADQVGQVTYESPHSH